MTPTLTKTTLHIGAAVLFTGCAAPTSRMAHAPQPAACTDSIYVQLSRQPPDSLSERAWQRLQALDSGCARARAEAPKDTHGMPMMGMGGGSGKVWMILTPIIVAGMAVMMVVF